MSDYYPVYLNLKGRPCVIIGGGRVAEGKISRLREAGARITVISPQVTEEIRAAAQQGQLQWCDREYQEGDLQNAFLAVAATNVRSVNRQIFQEAERQNVLLNVVDDAPLCTFIAPSIVERGPVTLAISTAGASPALARKLRESLTNDPVLDWADLAGVMSQVRSQIKKQGAVVDPQRWQCCLSSQLLDLARSGRQEEAGAKLLSDLLDGDTPRLCPRIDECLPQGCTSKPLAQSDA
jgi:precorrin-2 dehydrogenase/sirohydrochlorin ferrochelatase